MNEHVNNFHAIAEIQDYIVLFSALYNRALSNIGSIKEDEKNYINMIKNKDIIIAIQ